MATTTSTRIASTTAARDLDHSQISLTLGTYSHVVPELAHEGAERMAGVLWDSKDEQSQEPAGLAGLWLYKPKWSYRP